MPETRAFQLTKIMTSGQAWMLADAYAVYCAVMAGLMTVGGPAANPIMGRCKRHKAMNSTEEVADLTATMVNFVGQLPEPQE